jgi:hypothetical protein
MAAGLGFKTFASGDVLSAGDVNGYLMQGVLVFASAAARDAAITSPQEGQFAFTKDTNGLWYYDGAAWVASGATGDIEGVTAGIGISGGGTSGTVTVTNSMATAIDAKGDLVAGTGADAFSRLAVGANDTVLTADSTAATGLKWATPTAGGYTAIATTTLNNTATSYTYSSLGSYKHIVIVGMGLQTSNTAATDLAIEFNGDTGSNYYWSHSGNNAGTALAQAFTSQARVVIRRPLGWNADSSFRFGSFIAEIPLYGSSQYKQVQAMASSYADGSAYSTNIGGYWNSTAAITSIKIYDTSSSNLKAGTFTVYGVN